MSNQENTTVTKTISQSSVTVEVNSRGTNFSFHIYEGFTTKQQEELVFSVVHGVEGLMAELKRVGLWNK